MRLVQELSVLSVDQLAQDWNYIFGGIVFKAKKKKKDVLPSSGIFDYLGRSVGRSENIFF